MKYTCVIVDDEPLAHEVLEGYISKIDTLVQAKKFCNAVEAEKYLNSNPIDILFLDIQMPEMTGLELLKRLPEKPITILTTAFRDFALEGFELGVMDYLLKPIQPERFTGAVNKVIEFLSLKKLGTQMIEDKNPRGNIAIKSGTKTISLTLASVTHIQGLKDYSIVYTNDNKKYVIKGYLKVIGKIFSRQDFIRIHKSFIVARNCIKSINRDKIEIGSYIIPVGRVFKDDVMSALRSH
jgi:DNA-binding LytR/AlgR family response regulator